MKQVLHLKPYLEFTYTGRFVQSFKYDSLNEHHLIRSLMFGQRPAASGDIIATQTYIDGTDTTYTVDAVYYQPLIVPYPIHITAIGVRVATANSGAACIVGIYGDYRGSIVTLVGSGTIPLTATGVQEIAVDIYLTEGMYWWAIVIDDNVVQLNDTQFNFITSIPQRDPELVIGPEYYIKTSQATLPDTPSGHVPANGRVPWMYARIGT